MNKEAKAIRKKLENPREAKNIVDKVEKGYCKYDLWDLGCYVSKVLSNMLMELAENIHGYPNSFGDDETWSSALYTAGALLEEAEEKAFSFEKDLIEEGKELHKIVFNFLSENYYDLWD